MQFEVDEKYLKTLERTKSIAKERKLVLNCDEGRVNKIVGLLTKAKDRFDTYSCPCKSEHPHCQCEALEEEIAVDGHCRCRLFYAN